MLFRRQQPAAQNGEAAAAVAPPPPPPSSVLDGTETDKAAKVKLAVQKFRTDIYRIALRMKVCVGSPWGPAAALVACHPLRVSAGRLPRLACTVAIGRAPLRAAAPKLSHYLHPACPPSLPNFLPSSHFFPLVQYPTRASVMQQMMYRLGMAERIHLGTAAGPQRGIEDLAQMGGCGSPG